MLALDIVRDDARFSGLITTAKLAKTRLAVPLRDTPLHTFTNNLRATTTRALFYDDIPLFAIYACKGIALNTLPHTPGGFLTLKQTNADSTIQRSHSSDLALRLSIFHIFIEKGIFVVIVVYVEYYDKLNNPTLQPNMRRATSP